MLTALNYPFDAKLIMRKKKALRRELLADEGANAARTTKKIAILGGSTTENVKQVAELFLLNNGIAAEWYESEYDQWYEDALFGNPELDAFAPDVVFIQTGTYNLRQWPKMSDSAAEVEAKLDAEHARFEQAWMALAGRLACPIIQANFEPPYFRLLGNLDAVDYRGRVGFVNRLNQRFCDYAAAHQDFYLLDVAWVAADFGLSAYQDRAQYHQFKYPCAQEAIPHLAYQLANLIKALFGKNKKGFALDLDNTLWGGVVGDDGPENLVIGEGTGDGEAFYDWQEYLKLYQDIGIILTVASKNEEANALAGLNHPECALHPADFVNIHANWEPKSANVKAIAAELSLGADAFVFVDDNPAEREIVRQQVEGIAVPEVSTPDRYVHDVDRGGWFETVSLSTDDAGRVEMYKENAERKKLETSFSDYHDYLLSLDMDAGILPFDAVSVPRITALVNKSNQFNLTTRRYTQPEIEAAMADPNQITIYGRLRDKFGDNGLISVVVGEIAKNDPKRLDIVLWLMSCRVLKRDMEFAMMDELTRLAQERGIERIYGHYYPTKKNAMVKDFYAAQHFQKLSEDEKGNSEWLLDLRTGYKEQQDVIKVN
ncbi:MAG: HAD-IIIC family phosphatase [Coriobacteriales bacterium]|jgi:FkbH-like protein|nr:HAD-IIIC family phosphatase [Coriobacteriales bacterium]